MNVYFGSFPRSGSHIISLILSKVFELNVKKHGMAIDERFFYQNSQNTNFLSLSHEPLPINHQFTHAILLIRNPLESIIRHNELDLVYGKSRGDKYETSHTKEKFIPNYLKLIDNFEKIEIPKKVIYYEDFMTNLEKLFDEISVFLGKKFTQKPQIVYDTFARETKENHRFSSKFGIFDPNQHSKNIPEDKYKIYLENFENINLLKRYFQ